MAENGIFIVVQHWARAALPFPKGLTKR